MIRNPIDWQYWAYSEDLGAAALEKRFNMYSAGIDY
jgi:hypothetical protein